jgi:hypothetical protein
MSSGSEAESSLDDESGEEPEVPVKSVAVLQEQLLKALNNLKSVTDKTLKAVMTKELQKEYKTGVKISQHHDKLRLQRVKKKGRGKKVSGGGPKAAVKKQRADDWGSDDWLKLESWHSMSDACSVVKAAKLWGNPRAAGE